MGTKTVDDTGRAEGRPPGDEGMSLRGRVTSLLARIVLTYCAAMVTGGVLVVAFMMLLSAGLGGSSVGELIPLLPVLGVGLAMLSAHVLGLGWGTGLGIVLMPLPLLALGSLDLPSDVTVAAALALPLLVALALHPHDLSRIGR